MPRTQKIAEMAIWGNGHLFTRSRFQEVMSMDLSYKDTHHATKMQSNHWHVLSCRLQKNFTLKIHGPSNSICRRFSQPRCLGLTFSPWFYWPSKTSASMDHWKITNLGNCHTKGSCQFLGNHGFGPGKKLHWPTRQKLLAWFTVVIYIYIDREREKDR